MRHITSPYITCTPQLMVTYFFGFLTYFVAFCMLWFAAGVLRTSSLFIVLFPSHSHFSLLFYSLTFFTLSSLLLFCSHFYLLSRLCLHQRSTPLLSYGCTNLYIYVYIYIYLLSISTGFRYYVVNDPGVVFLFFFFWGHVLTAFSFFFSVFFQKSRTATGLSSFPLSVIFSPLYSTLSPLFLSTSLFSWLLLPILDISCTPSFISTTPCCINCSCGLHLGVCNRAACRTGHNRVLPIPGHTPGRHVLPLSHPSVRTLPRSLDFQ